MHEPFPGPVDIEHIDNPRVEIENHYYNFTHTALEASASSRTCCPTPC